MKKIFDLQFVFQLVLWSVFVFSVKHIAYQQGYLQSMRDRIVLQKMEIDSLTSLADSARVSSFPDHSEIPTNNLKP